MELLANDLSVHGQFPDEATFREALSRVMAIRNAARRRGQEVHCHRTFLVASPIPGVSMQQAIMGFALDSERRAAMTWLTRAGPFWDDMRRHGGEDWLECRGDIVTDTAVGESAFRQLHGVECGLVSFSPSDWKFAPIEVTWCREAEGFEDKSAALENWWNVAALEYALRDKAPPVRSWIELGEICPVRFEGLIFARNCFAPLEGVPFAKSAAERFFVLLGILDTLTREKDEKGARTKEGHRIYRDYFMGDRALFSDSSDSEKREFQRELTFAHPENSESSLFCTWHGKVSRQTLRLHFSWPVGSREPVHVVYAGPKITKR